MDDTNRKSMQFSAQLSCRISKGAYSDCAVSAGRLQDFYSNIMPAVHGSAINSRQISYFISSYKVSSSTLVLSHLCSQ